MGKEIIDDKLDTKPTQPGRVKTDTKKKLLFTDYSIDRFEPNYINEKNRTQDRKITSFGIKHGILKGLKLACYRKTKTKYFFLKYWYNNKYLPLTIGKFVPGKFGSKECQEKLSEVVKTHTNEKGYWIKDPRAFIKAREKKIFDKEEIKHKQKSLRQVIEYAVSADFPSNKKDGRLAATTIKELTLPSIGYNKRTLLMKFSDDKKGYGKIFYRGNPTYGIVKPGNAEDMFNKFPPGHGIISTRKLSKYKNNQQEISMYDDDIGSYVMEILNTQVIRNYIFSKDRSYSKKRNLRRAFKYFWNLANNKGWISGDVRDPTDHMDIPLPDKVEYSGARFNHKRFTPAQLTAVWAALVKNEKIHPFSTEAVMLMCVTGKRKQELLKIRKEYIKEDEGVIVMPHFIMKTKKDHEITITEPVKWVLNKLKERLKESKYQKYTFVPWLFPSTKTKSSKLYDQEYTNGNGTRLQDVRYCWLDVVKETGIDSSSKMLRKTFISLGMQHLNEHWKMQMLTGHAKASTIDVHYNKSDREQRKEYADEVADKVFNFVK